MSLNHDDLAAPPTVQGNTTNAPSLLPLAEIRALVDAQAEDEGLWFLAATGPEAYLQQELRRLHALVERVTDE